MTKYKPYSRIEYRRRWTQWAQRNVALLGAAIAGLVGLLALETFLIVGIGQPSPLSWWLLGATQVGLLAVFFHLLQNAFLANDRDAIRHLRGAWGEDNTRSELQVAKRKRLIWGWVDSITFQSGDIDHLVVTRQGGIVVIDTKWRSDTHDAFDMARSARRAKSRAEALARTLLAREYRARHRQKSNPMPVTPLVVVWGAAQRSLPERARCEGIDFIPGRQLRRWLADMDGEPVSKSAAADLLKRVEDFRATAWSSTHD